MGEVEAGNVVDAVWYDDPTWHRGVVLTDSNGLYIVINENVVGYLKDADDYALVKCPRGCGTPLTREDPSWFLCSTCNSSYHRDLVMDKAKMQTIIRQFQVEGFQEAFNDLIRLRGVDP